MSLRIKFTGTGSGLAVKERFQSSFLLFTDDSVTLTDCGDGISKALAAAGEDPCLINRIIITHFHPDHYAGFPFLIVQMKILGRKTPLTVYAPSGDISFLRELLHRSYIFTERISFSLEFKELNDGDVISDNSGVSIEIRRNSHLDEYRKYDLNGALSFTSFSMTISDGEKEVFYSGDIGGISDITGGVTGKTGIIITETSHISSEEILGLIESSDKKIYLTHLDYDKETELKNLLDSAPELNGRYIFAADGMTIEY
ncbi:MAG: ribonuclease Z [Ignavibacteriaceae bacterium]|nr:ribonuclease Z [Ignavibacteriaceae bacterium]